MQQSLGALAPRDHAVTFYDTVDEGVATMAAFVAEGLALGERVVVVATAAHRTALEDLLAGAGTDLGRSRRDGRYVVLDAKATLDVLMVDGSPDADRFATHVGARLTGAGKGGPNVRVFGEMVALLWEGGNVAAALELERLWNELAQRHPFVLLCAYPSTILTSAHVGEISRVCGQHSVVLPPAGYESDRRAFDAPDLYRRTETFVPLPEAVAAVRRFVTGVLRLWGEDDLVPDATLVISEIATNAVMHAESAFRAFVERDGGVIRMAIEDAGSGFPESLSATGDDLNGRGVAIVEALADRWGCDAVANGKVVWAELVSARIVDPVG